MIPEAWNICFWRRSSHQERFLGYWPLCAHCGSRGEKVKELLLTDSTMDDVSVLGDFTWIDEWIHASKSCSRKALHAKESICGTRENGHSGRNACE
jgi:hypothetical protein